MLIASIFVYAFFAFIAVTLLNIGVASVELEQIPTSHPTMFFMAPSVPDESGEEGVISVTNFPTMSPTSATSGNPSAGTGDSYKDEVIEENQTAVNTSSYMFYTFLGLFAVVAGGYYVKRCISVILILPTVNYNLLYLSFTAPSYLRRRCMGGGSAQEAPRYQPVHTRDHDDDDFFSNRNIEMTRGGFSNTRHF